MFPLRYEQTTTSLVGTINFKAPDVVMCNSLRAFKILCTKLTSIPARRKVPSFSE